MSAAKKCSKCSEEFKGFGDTCSKCRKLGKSGTFRDCEVCGAYVSSYGSICDSCSKGEPDTHISVMPLYTIPEGKMQDFTNTFPAFYDAVQKGPKESLYFGWCVSDNQVISRQAFGTPKALLGQLHEVGVALEVCRTILGEEGCIDVTIVGPTAELEALQGHLEVLSPKYFELDVGSRWYNRGTAGPDTHVQAVPVWTVPEGKAKDFQALLGKFYEASKKSTKERLYYGWARRGNDFMCRQGFKSAEGVLSHMQDLKDVMKEALDVIGANATLTVLAPKDEIEKLQTSGEVPEHFKTRYFELDPGSVWL